MKRAQTYQVPNGTGKTKNGIIPVPIIVNGTNTHNSGDVAKQGSVRANLLGIIPFAKKLFSKKKEPAPAPRKPNPEGELVISFYDSTKELLSTEILSLKSENEWETLSFSTKAEEKGFVSASIRGTSSAPVKFDDFSIQLKSLYSAKLYQENHYYPFGMNMKGLENEDFQTVQNKDEHLWQYNSKERQDEFNLFWADYGARNYDSQVGRWHGVDPLAEDYFVLSPFVYVANSPINATDPDGMKIVPVNLNKEHQRVFDVAMGLSSFQTTFSYLIQSEEITARVSTFRSTKRAHAGTTSYHSASFYGMPNHELSQEDELALWGDMENSHVSGRYAISKLNEIYDAYGDGKDVGLSGLSAAGTLFHELWHVKLVVEKGNSSEKQHHLQMFRDQASYIGNKLAFLDEFKKSETGEGLTENEKVYHSLAGVLRHEDTYIEKDGKEVLNPRVAAFLKAAQTIDPNTGYETVTETKR